MKGNRGFTLIELLVVISIIALLSSVVLSSLNTARGKARDARRAADARQYELAFQLYYDANGSYPAGAGVGFYTGSSAGWFPELAPYLPTRSLDPVTNDGNYFYYYINNVQASHIGGAAAWDNLGPTCLGKTVFVVRQMEQSTKNRQDCAMTDPKSISIVLQ